MPGSTPVYGLPYQELGDAPHGPNLGQQLATEVEAELVRMDTVPTMQVFTASGTWNKPAGLKAVRVRVVGGGGGGGGANPTSSVQAAVGGGGGGGGYAEEIIPAASLGASETVTVGAGGTGVPPNAPGTASSFGAHLTGNGGGAGAAGAQASSAVSAGGVGGTGTGGTINITGEAGRQGRWNGGIIGSTSSGGSSQLGQGGPPSAAILTGDGNAGQLYGGGGSGGLNQGTQAATRNGGNGANGVVIVENLF